jgi:ribosome-associated protein
MNTQKLQRTIVDALEDVKAQDIQVYNTTDESDLFDRVILASGTSNRQTRSLAKSVMDKVRENGGTIIGCEGEESGDWVLVDCGDIVVHIMQPAVRAFYNLEEVWGRKPVRMKLNPDSLRVPNQ